MGGDILMNVEALVITMHQVGTEKYKTMNLQTDAVIANQTDRNFYIEENIDNHKVKMVSTDTRGISRNRNIALAYATADLIMFTDDDVCFRDGYEKLILKEFAKHPEAEAIKFELETIAISEAKDVGMKKVEKDFRPASRRELARYGVCGLVVCKTVLQKHCLHFNELFGSGTENYCGEDTIFLQNMVNRGIKLYLSPVCIGDIDKSNSTWFEGYNEKYFQVTGKALGTVYHRFAYLIALRSAYKFCKRGKCTMGFAEILKCYFLGIKNHE